MNGLHTTALTLAAALCLTGCCVKVARMVPDDAHWRQVKPKQFSDVLVTGGDLRRRYRPIARIYVRSAKKDKERSFQRLQEKAAQLGADAVISVKMDLPGQVHYPKKPYFLEGIAVVYEAEPAAK